MLAERIPAIQSALAEAGLEGWFFACFQQNDPIGLDLLGLAGEGKLVTRRCYYLVPREGEPRKLVHALEPAMLDHLPGTKSIYLTWQKHREEVAKLVSGFRRLAAQYSPDNELPSVSRLDAGTADLLRSAGIELVSAADLAQRFAATWSEEQLAGHRRANVHLHRIVLEAFHRVSDLLRRGDQIDEYGVQRFILDAFELAGLWAESDPIVGVNAHSADPHYQPGPEQTSPIREGDFLLIDLWAKEKQPGSVYADITWVGVCAASPSAKQQEIFTVVAAARDAGWELVRSRYPAPARARLRGGRRHPRGDPQRGLRRSLHPPHRPFDRHLRPRPGRQHGQPGDPRHAAAPADDGFLHRARRSTSPATSECAARSTSPSPPKAPRSPAASPSASCCGCWRDRGSDRGLAVFLSSLASPGLRPPIASRGP